MPSCCLADQWCPLLQFELLFCVQDEEDPAINLVNRLKESYPKVDVKLFIGMYHKVDVKFFIK